MTQLAFGIFLCMVAFAGGLFFILMVVGLFWILRLNIIGRVMESKTASPVATESPVAPVVSILPLS